MKKKNTYIVRNGERWKKGNRKNNWIFNKWREEMIWPEWYWLVLRKRRSLIIIYSQSTCFDCWRLDLYSMSRMNGAEINEWAFKLFFFVFVSSWEKQRREVMCFCLCTYVWAVCVCKQEIRNKQELLEADMFEKTIEIERKWREKERNGLQSNSLFFIPGWQHDT